jgi:hypothetical protein
MEVLSIRASVQGWSDKELSSQDLSDLLWAANVINRPDSKKRTSSSARNAQDIDVYVFMKQGVYLYDAANHALNLVLNGDHRSKIAMPRPGVTSPPARAGEKGSSTLINLVLISDISRFGGGTQELKLEWGAIDTGIVSQNIALFCGGKRLGTRPRASISKENLREHLKLRDTQYPFLEHPVGYLAATQ